MMLSQCIRRVVLYEPVKEKKKKTGWHIWKQPSFKRAEEEVMLTASNFLTGAEMMKEAAPPSPSSTHFPPLLTIIRCSFKKNIFLREDETAAPC